MGFNKYGEKQVMEEDRVVRRNLESIQECGLCTIYLLYFSFAYTNRKKASYWTIGLATKIYIYIYIFHILTRNVI